MSNKRPNKRSTVWEHFEPTPNGERAICNYCGESLGAKSTNGTTHLKRHLDSCSKHRDPDPANKVRKIVFTQDEYWEMEVKKSVLAEIPFTSSDCQKGFNSLNCFKGMDIEKSIHAYYQREREKLIAKFENLTSGVSLTVHIMMEAGYVSISAHFINDDFNLVKKLIGFKKIISSKTVESIILSCISDWRIAVADERSYITCPSRYFHIVFDVVLSRYGLYCGPSRKEDLTQFYRKLLKSIFHLELGKIVEFIKSVGTTKSKMDEFNKIAKEQGLPPIDVALFMEFKLDTAGYNYIFRIIEYSFGYKEVFRQYAPKEANPMFLSQINWERAELILNFCQRMNDMINGLSSFKNPTLHLYFQYLVKIKDEIGILQNRGETFRDDFEEYLMEAIGFGYLLSDIACVLDPRCKLYPFEYIEATVDSEDTKGIRETVHGRLQKLFDEYANEESNQADPLHIRTTSTTNTQDEGSSSNSAHPDQMQSVHGFSAYMSQKLKLIPTTSELDKYLSEKVVVTTDGSFDVLGWWKENKSRYPVLSKMARGVLALPASVYEVDEYITYDLGSLEGVDPQLVEAVICCKDWILSNS